MKNSSLGTKLLMAAICLAVLMYFALQGYRYFADPLTTTMAYSYQVEQSLSVAGWVVRDEQVLADQTGGLLRLSRSEGERVSRGGTVAVVYADQASLEKQTEIDGLETQIAQLQYAQEAVLSSEASLKLDSQITDRILELQQDLAADRLSEADSHVRQLRSLILKRDYTYAGDTELDGRIQELQSQVKSLKAAASSSTKRITAPASGVYSAVVDGYETVLRPDALASLTPSDLTAITPDSTVSSEVGKLILGDSWYYVAAINAADAENLTVGQTLTLRFAKSTDQDLTVEVASLSPAENGRVAAVFSSSRYLSRLTLLRQQSADLISETVEGIRVPQNAIRVSEDGVTGIYCVVGMTARFKPVTVRYTGEGFALVTAASDEKNNILRPGDEVIVPANDLYDGKVVG